MIRIGQGFDVHKFEVGRPLILGGVLIPHDKGLTGHSDADVLLHTITDAALGAIGEGDIGRHFPDTDNAFKEADSAVLLEKIWELVTERGYKLGNIDCTVIAEQPKMAPHIGAIQKRVAELLQADISQVNIKATTTRKSGFTGRKEGLRAMAADLVQKESRN